MERLNILVGCEKSGIVRDSFRKRGHNAYSCDLVETDRPSKYHLKCDIRKAIRAGGDSWDMLIFFPPCTHLARSGAKWFSPKSAWFRPEKIQLQRDSIQFVKDIWNEAEDIPRIGMENPCGVLTKQFRHWDQIVSPNWFGDRIQKLTCLWLKNLPPP